MHHSATGEALEQHSYRFEIDSRHRGPNMTQHEHVYVIYCRLEVGDGGISGCNAMTLECMEIY